MKNIYCTLDTETFGGAVKPKGIYNLSGIIHDKTGHILASFNYLIGEHYEEIEKDTYGKRNFQRYLDLIENAEITTIGTEDMAIQAVEDLLTFYDVKYVMCFNSSFDLTRTKCKSLIENREFIDIYLMFKQIFDSRPSYTKFCDENGFKTKIGNNSCSAQTAYAFITNNPKYKEEHTALQDALIEKEIFERCVKAHKPYTKNCHCRDFYCKNKPKGEK